ncbi:MAG: TIGR01777 family oxidoreductase [Dehalococcoidia bacterium]
MKVLVSGSTGLIGSALVPVLRERGHEVVRLVRSRALVAPDAVFWDPQAGDLDAAGLEGVDAAVHLSGESVASLRWIAGKKARIYESRIRSTRLLVETLSGLSRRPSTFLCASAIGYYGDRGDEVLREESGPGEGFLASLGRDWEAEAARAGEAGMREAQLRFGIVLTPQGGALRTMLRPFRWGLGARMGDGRQYFSWIALDDALAAIVHILDTPDLQGPINVVAPIPVTNRELTATLGRVLGRPALLATPAALLRLVMGQMAEEGLLASVRAEPAKLVAAGFPFQHPDLDGALRGMLARGS